MQKIKYIYTFNYDKQESGLCKLESRCIFNEEEKNKLLFSNVKVEPSSSAFIKNRFDIVLFSEEYTVLINEIKNKNINIEGFKVEYLVFEGDTTEYKERLEKLRDIGYSIEGNPDYYNPIITYALCLFEGVWFFGVLNKDKFDWHKHKHKPNSYSNSISVNIAKSLVNIAANGNKDKKIIDACCGVGTILLEACFSGFNTEGCDINEKICNDARGNLSYFNYSTNIYNSDIKDVSEKYDTAIIDLPYNLLSIATDNDISHIIESTTEITDRLIIVSIVDITNLISKANLEILDSCSVSKSGKRKFARKIWVCEKNGLV